MALTPFTRELGAAQGRIQPANWTPPEGDFVLCMGSDLPGRVVWLNPGDKIAATQTSDAGSGKLIRPRMRARAPLHAPPPGFSWRGRFKIAGATVGEIMVALTQDWTDAAANVSGVIGTYAMAFELELVGPGGPVEVELPGFYVDAIILDEPAGRPILANRYPPPSSLGAPRDTNIRLDVMDTTASGVSAAATKVYIDGELAFDGGVFMAGWTGLESVTQSLDGGRTRRVVIDPLVPFSGEQVVEVRVISATNDGAPVDVTYQFTCEDVDGPAIESAQAIGESTVRVVFDEAVQSDGAAGALTASNWSVTLADSSIAVWANISSVASVTPTTVDLTTDIPLTAGAAYRVAAFGIEDNLGNPVSAPDNAAVFVAYGEQAVGRSFRVRDLIPPVDGVEDYDRFMAVIQEVTDLLLRRIDRWADIIDIDLAPEAFVDIILQDLGNPFPFELTLLEKRRLGRLLVPIYRSKGLARGIKNAIRVFMGLEVTLDYPNFRGLRLGSMRLGSSFRLAGDAYDAYSFEVHAPRTLTDVERDRIRAIATYMMVGHEHLVRIVEPAGPPPVIDHLALGRSRLGRNWILH